MEKIEKLEEIEDKISQNLVRCESENKELEKDHTTKLTFVNLAWNIVRADNCWLNVYDASTCFDINNFMFDCRLHSLMDIFAFFAHITLTKNAFTKFTDLCLN
jgi:hypothetical protein